MAAFLPAMAAMMGANVLGSVIGNEQARDRQRASERSLKDARDRLGAIDLPEFDTSLPDLPVLEQAAEAPSLETLSPVQLEQLALAGQLTPEMVQAFQQGDTELAATYQDPELQAARIQALAELQGISSEGGLTAIDEARLAEIQSRNDQAARGRREAVMQNMNARGMGGSGMELINQLQANQAATDLGARQSLDVAAMAQQRALDALMQGTNLAGQMSREDLDRQMQVARAQDAINRFNLGLQTSADQTNVAALNNAQSRNLGEQQRVMDANVGLRNQQAQMAQDTRLQNNAIRQQGFGNQMTQRGFDNANRTQTYNQQLGQVQMGDDRAQRQFNNEYRRAGGMGQIDQAMSGVHANEAQATRDMWQGIGRGASTAATAFFEDDE